MSNFVVIVGFANGLAPIYRSRIRKGLVLESYGWFNMISFTTGTDVSPLVNMPEASSMAHGIDSKDLIGTAGSVICASLSVFNLIWPS